MATTWAWCGCGIPPPRAPSPGTHTATPWTTVSAAAPPQDAGFYLGPMLPRCARAAGKIRLQARASYVPDPEVRRTPSWPRSWADFSLLSPYSHRILHLLGQPNTFLAGGRGRAGRGGAGRDRARAAAGQGPGGLPHAEGAEGGERGGAGGLRGVEGGALPCSGAGALCRML